MAKKTPRSQVNDAAAASAGDVTPALPKPRSRSRSTRVGEAGQATKEASNSPASTEMSYATMPDAAIDLPDMAAHAASMGSEPSEEDIRLRAYHRYLARGGSHGADFDDWLRAEEELKRKR